MAWIYNLYYIFFIFFIKLFDKKTADKKKANKKKVGKKINRILFDWAGNISTIDLIIGTNFSNSFFIDFHNFF